MPIKEEKFLKVGVEPRKEEVKIFTIDILSSGTERITEEESKRNLKWVKDWEGKRLDFEKFGKKPKDRNKVIAWEVLPCNVWEEEEEEQRKISSV